MAEWYGICNEQDEILLTKDGEQIIAPNLALAQEIALSIQYFVHYTVKVRRLDAAPMTEELFEAKRRAILAKVAEQTKGFHN